MAEFEKKTHAGNTISESIRNVIAGQATDYSKNFPNLEYAKKIPGFIRSYQEIPFKVMMASFDQLRLGAEYLNKIAFAFLCVDSSGKFWAEKTKKSEPKKLNSALVAPPPIRGQSPFPIFETISEVNKTIDFLTMLQYAWHYMSMSINKEVKFPKVIISDISFANIHSILQFFNNIKIGEYLKLAFTSLKKNSQLPVKTVITICESHLLPAMLKYARSAHKKKAVADTFVAGVLLMFQAKDFKTACAIWENLVKIHCSKQLDREAQNNVKSFSYGDQYDEDDKVTENNFNTNEDDPEELGTYEKKETIRGSSPFGNEFRAPIEKLEQEEESITEITNPFYCPDLVKLFCNHYLTLYPLFSASVLSHLPIENGDALKNIAYVELHWENSRRLLSKIDKRVLWPPVYFGILHQHMQRKATEMITQKYIPNLRMGGKNKKVSKNVVDFMDLGKDKKLFNPKDRKKNEKQKKPKEDFNASIEEWGPKKRKTKETNTYIKNKILDYKNIEEHCLKKKTPHNERVEKKVIVTGPGAVPQRIEVSKERMDEVLTEFAYIDTETVDAALSLLDRKLSEDCNYDENVVVYDNTMLRLISTGDRSFIRPGKFIAIMPRRFVLAEEAEAMEAIKQGKWVEDVDLGHFSLISNINCRENEVKIYETLDTFRSRNELLTISQKNVLKIITGTEKVSLKVHCVNVVSQTESECAAIAFGLAVKLCFTSPDERSVFEEFVDVRRDFSECLKNNNLNNFRSRKVKSDSNDIIFSINIP